MDADFITFKSAIENARSEQDTFARFYDRSVKTGEVNPKTGVPVFKNKCYVEIRIKNNNTDVYDQPATEDKIARFPVEYNRYLLSKKEIQEGTGLENFSFLSAAQIETLKYHGIRTLEKLETLSPAQAQDLDVLAEYEAVKRFLSGAKEQLTQTQWEEKLMKLETRVKELESQLEVEKANNAGLKASLAEKSKQSQKGLKKKALKSSSTPKSTLKKDKG